jgi:1,4-dihydroxy-2-naphthoate octaprenyltransferase
MSSGNYTLAVNLGKSQALSKYIFSLFDAFLFLFIQLQLVSMFVMTLLSVENMFTDNM